MTPSSTEGDSPADRAHRVADRAGQAADDVDRQARFPAEAAGALRAERLLSLAIPVVHGGEGVGLEAVSDVVRIIGQKCASSAMVYAMHQIQVWCLVQHGDNPTLRDVLGQVAGEQLLLASATSEVTVGGDVRTSVCAVERHGEQFTLTKDAPVISYGQHADAVLTTARRTPDSAPSDQVLVYCPAGPGLTLEPKGEWDTIGFRGTCSLGYHLHATGPLDLILTSPYGEISAVTMLPVSHILWASVWLGLAEAAAASAHTYVRGQARQKPGTTPAAATRLAELAAVLQQFRGLVRAALGFYAECQADTEILGGMSFAVAMNSLKVSASTMVVDVVSRALTICGMAGYRLDSPYSMGRLLRDAYGAAVMINNDRIIANSAQLLLASKEM